MLTNNVERPRIPLNLRSEIGFVRTLSKNTRWNREKRADSVQSAVCEVRVLCFRDKRISPGKNHCHSTLAYRVRNARRGRAPRTTQNLPAPYSGKKICETAGSKDVSTTQITGELNVSSQAFGKFQPTVFEALTHISPARSRTKRIDEGDVGLTCHKLFVSLTIQHSTHEADNCRHQPDSR